MSEKQVLKEMALHPVRHAQTIGTLIKEEIGVSSEVLVLDGVSLWDFDYVDLGRVRMPSFTVPVTIKSLVFSEDPRRPHRHVHPHQHHHHHHEHHSDGHHHDHGHHHPHGAGAESRSHGD